MFTQQCFIRKNTSKLRDSLNKIGIIPYFLKEEGNTLTVVKGKYNIEESYIGDTYRNNIIDCGGNETLFLALAALRDDSNEHQWFVWNLKEGEETIGDRWKLYDDNSNWSWWIFECHKATVEELIEHFK